MPSMSLFFEVYCAQCGAGLCDEVEVKHESGKPRAVFVRPCRVCLERYYNKRSSEEADVNELIKNWRG